MDYSHYDPVDDEEYEQFVSDYEDAASDNEADTGKCWPCTRNRRICDGARPKCVPQQDKIDSTESSKEKRMASET
jgi:hypothetical protein